MINGLTNVVLTRVDVEDSRALGFRVDESQVIQVPPNTDIPQWVKVYFQGWDVYQVFTPSGYDEF